MIKNKEFTKIYPKVWYILLIPMALLWKIAVFPANLHLGARGGEQEDDDNSLWVII